MKLGRLNSSERDYTARIILFMLGITAGLLGIFQIVTLSFLEGVPMVIVGIFMILVSVIYPLHKAR
ncbi:MAG: hypothetical protein U9Q21_04310 [Candidatus Auribacterota bacterium]|nr:hypothetical protein [Candidatus Auribacterota bacterium]